MSFFLLTIFQVLDLPPELFRLSEYLDSALGSAARVVSGKVTIYRFRANDILSVEVALRSNKAVFNVGLHLEVRDTFESKFAFHDYTKRITFMYAVVNAQPR
jgi:hypothetical protein